MSNILKKTGFIKLEGSNRIVQINDDFTKIYLDKADELLLILNEAIIIEEKLKQFGIEVKVKIKKPTL